MGWRDRDFPVDTIRTRLDSVERRSQQYATQASHLGHSLPAQHLRTAAGEAARLKRMYPPGSSSTSRQIKASHESQITNGVQAMLRNITVARAYFEASTMSRTRMSSRTVQTQPRLLTQVIRPDIFMVAPPRCNVIFPELANSISFQRMYMREVTRMRLTVSDEIFGPEALLDSVYYAPDLEVLGARPPRRRHGRGSEAGTVAGPRLSRAAYSKRLMNHELLTGVVPVFERMNEVNIYAARTDQVSHRGARIPYVMRAVNHQFYKHRWQPRQMNVSGKFNPYLAPGFPAVIMDRPMTRSQVEDSNLRGVDYLERTGGMAQALEDLEESRSRRRDGAEDRTSEELAGEQYGAWNVLRDAVPNQFVGMLENLQHNVTHTSAGTSMSLTHARIHRENEVLLGANERQLTRRSMLRREGRGRARSRRGTPGGGSRIAGSRALPSSASGAAETAGTRRRARLGSFFEAGGEEEDSRAIRVTTVAALETPQIGMVGPYFGEVVGVMPSQETGEFPLFGTFFGDRVRRRQRKAQVGVEMRAFDLGDEVVTQAGGPEMMVTLRPYRIREAIDRWVGQSVEVPLEDFIRPPWMSDVWRTDRIGAVYNQFFATGAITDATVIDTPDLQMSPGAHAADDFLTHAAAAEREANAADPVRADGRTTQIGGLEITVERAIDLLVRAYSALKHEDMDIHEFIRAYTWRPVATLPQILGTRDLEIDADGNATPPGAEGFHSRAFGRGQLGRNLRNLVDSDARQVLGLDTGIRETHRRSVRRTEGEGADARTVRSTRSHVTHETAEERTNALNRMDKRSEKSDRVLAYVAELNADRGLLG